MIDVRRIDGWRYAPPGSWNVSAVDDLLPGQSAVQGWAPVEFDGVARMPGFPLRVSSYSGDAYNYSRLAIGPSSNLADWLVDSGLAPSRLVSFYAGSRSQLHGEDGEIMFGGYDRSRLAGEWTDYPINAGLRDASDCPLQILIRDIKVNQGNGSSSLLADSRSSIPACVDPLQNNFWLTPSIFDRYMRLAGWNGSVADRVQTPTFSPSAAPLLCNVTVSIAIVMSVYVPNYEMVSQVRGPNDVGTYAVTDPSRLQLAVSTNNTARVPTLGGVFMSQLYMKIDYERGIFSLAPAVVGPRKQPRDVVTVCNANATSNVAPDTAPGSDNALGRIVGPAVAASIVGAGLIVLAIWCYRRNRKSKRRPFESESPDVTTDDESERIPYVLGH